MKKKLLRIFAGAFAVCFAFGASGCELVDTVKSWFDKEEKYEEITENANEAFEELKTAYENTCAYAGAFTADLNVTVNESYEGKKYDEKSYGAMLSVDNAKKRYYNEQSSTATVGFKIKEYEENGAYYSYNENVGPTGQSKSYKELSAITANYEYQSKDLIAWLADCFATDTVFPTVTATEIFDFVSPYFYARSFDILKAAHVQVFERGKEAREKEVSSSAYAKNVKADTNLSMQRGEEGGVALKIVQELETPNKLSSLKEADTLRTEIWVKEQDGRIKEIKKVAKYYRVAGDNKGERECVLKFDYEFAEKQFNDFKRDGSVELSGSINNTVKKDLTFDVNGEEYSFVVEIDVTQTPARFFNELINGRAFDKEQHGQALDFSITDGVSDGYLYLDEARTQELDIRNLTMEELLKTDKVYAKIVMEDGYALIAERRNPRYILSEGEKKFFYLADESAFGITAKTVKLDEQSEYTFTREFSLTYYINGAETEGNIVVCENKGFYDITKTRRWEEVNSLFRYCFSAEHIVLQ